MKGKVRARRNNGNEHSRHVALTAWDEKAFWIRSPRRAHKKQLAHNNSIPTYFYLWPPHPKHQQWKPGKKTHSFVTCARRDSVKISRNARAFVSLRRWESSRGLRPRKINFTLGASANWGSQAAARRPSSWCADKVI